MLKKILILALSLNTPYILPSHSSYGPRPNLAVSCAVLVSGIICAWLAYKGFKKGWQACKEVQNQIKILSEMGVKVYRVSKVERGFNSLALKEHYTMNIPSNFSQQQEEKAKKHWNLLLTNDKKIFTNMTGLAALGSLILIPAGILSIIKCIKALDF